MSSSDPMARWMSKIRVDEVSGCWIWEGTISSWGYGHFAFQGKSHKAHRWGFERLVGPVEGPLDHLCHTRSVELGECHGGNECIHRRCVNPDHLVPVTSRENILMGMSQSAINARKTHCHKGHLFDDANTHFTPDGRRVCRKCNSMKQRLWRQKQRRRHVNQEVLEGRGAPQ